MTSQINSNNIDGNYPVAGQPNNTQGMRDNFTATKTNFQYAADEINDLQSKAVLKSALTGSVIDNNMNDNLLYAVQLSDVSYKEVQQTATSGTITLDYSAAMYQSIPSVSGNISLAFTNWPSSGNAGSLNFAIVVSNTSYTLTLPATVSVGITTVDGLSPGTVGVTNTITFPANGTYVYVLETADGGSTISIENTIRPSNTYSGVVNISNTTPSTTTATGALTVAGGAGVSGNVYASNFYGNGNTLSNIYADYVFNGNSNLGIRSANGNANISINGTSNVVVVSSTKVTVSGASGVESVGTGTIGYGVGAGGTVSQSGNKSSGVTLNKQSGEITMQNTALGAATTVNFLLTNSTISATDLLLINQSSTANSGGYIFNAICGAGNANIAVRNGMSASASDTVVLRYAVIKGATT